MLRDSRVSIWALLIDYSGEEALLLDCSSSECRGCEDSFCSSFKALPLLLDTRGVVTNLKGAMLTWALRRAFLASIIILPSLPRATLGST